jgi:hypothetical protein
MKGVEGVNFGAEKRAEKSLEEDVFLVHPQNSLKGLILNWCTCGCWFTPAVQQLWSHLLLGDH